jgi:hypothetical protein
LTREGRELKILHFHLGPALQHTVYEAEVVGMILAVQLLRQEQGKLIAVIGINNQVAILATQSFTTNPRLLSDGRAPCILG